MPTPTMDHEPRPAASVTSHGPPGPAARASVGAIIAFLKADRKPLAREVADCFAEWGWWLEHRRASSLDDDEYATELYAALPDFLALYYKTGEESYRDLFVGELLRATQSPAYSPAEQQEKREEFADRMSRQFLGRAGLVLGGEALNRLRDDLDAAFGVLRRRGQRTIRILCVGDCMMFHVMSFLFGPCREEGLALSPKYLTSRNPVELRRTIQAEPADGYDLVFYSPFSYTFAEGLKQTVTSLMPMATVESIRRLIGPDLDVVRSTLDLISRRFDCPILVQNTANARMHDGSAVARLKGLATGRARGIARREVNWALEQHVKSLRGTARVDIVDEASLIERHSDFDLGRLYYHSDNQHLTAVSRRVASLYRDYMAVYGDFLTRKLVVCDLDNTLWEGEIGEGAVTHFADRQASLKRLRHKGVLLAINSRNDPANVHWRGSELTERDFVASRINWGSKADNIREIRDQLNLKPKDFIFVDDRADQRAIVSDVFPEILTLDATSDRVWKLIDLWSRWLPEDDGPDRTQLYHEREQREGFIGGEADDAEQTAAALGRLGLKAVIRLAREADLKRAVELINRTNQFNTNATRTSLGEIRTWLASPGHSVFLVDGADKFGQMGTVSVAMVEQEGTEARIVAFVLSCRVFGYGFEAALINAVRRRVARAGIPARVVGLFRETAANGPCRSTYPDRGFLAEGDRWVLTVDDAEVADPAWLAVEDRTS